MRWVCPTAVFAVYCLVPVVVRLLIDTRYVSSIYGLLQCFLNEAQDETRVVITQQAVRKKKAYTYIRFKDYVLTNL